MICRWHIYVTGFRFFTTQGIRQMHTLTAYYGSITNNVTDTLVPAIADQIGTRQDSRFMWTDPRTVLRAFAGVPDGTACRIDAPSFNGFVRPVISPIDADATLGGNLPAIVDFEGRGITLPRLENVGPLVTRAGAAAANCAVLLWHARTMVPAPPGKVYTVRATSASTGAAGAWQLATLTFDQALPSGKYAVIGMTCYGANLLCARLVPPGISLERPGVMANVDQTSWQYPSMRFGNSGLFTEFFNTNPPQIEYLSYGAQTTQIVYLDIINLQNQIGQV